MNRADADPGGGIKGIRREALGDVLFRELEVVVGREVLLEFLQGLPAEIAPVNEEQDPFGSAELDQAVQEVDGREGLAAAGRHLDDSAGSVLGKRLFEVLYRYYLRRPEPVFDQGRHLADAGVERRLFAVELLRRHGRELRCSDLSIGEPISKGFGFMEEEYLAGTRLGIKTVRKPGFDAC